MEAVIYDSSLKGQWDELVSKAVNSHFMHFRDYMEYHSDRFKDHSILFKDEKGKIIAVLPANLSDDVLYSHQGLTFGGVLVGPKVSAIHLLAIFECLTGYCREKGIKKIVYKRPPDLYYDAFFQDDLYALFLNDATLVRRDLNSTVDLTSNYKYSKGRKWSINKAKKESLEVFESDDYRNFWLILSEVLESHGAKPTHSIDEIISLHSFFPNNIKLFFVKDNDQILAGTLLFVNKEVVHTQYMASTPNGKEIGALDLLIHQLMSDYFKDKKYFNFGISTEDSGKYLNEGLLSQKNGFGARSTVHDFYEIDI